jgi:hypothetical protein
MFSWASVHEAHDKSTHMNEKYINLKEMKEHILKEIFRLQTLI